MNAKLKSILTAVWDGPRALFLWLLLINAIIFGSIAAGAANRTVGNPIAPALQMIALFALMGGFITLACFILAWIPPIHRMFVWLLRRRFLVLAILATLIALAYTIENWRGHHAWTHFQREWEAKGEHFNPADLTPPAVPDDQNFFMAEPWVTVLKTATNSLASDTENNSAPLLDAFGPNGSQSPGIGDLLRGKRINLTEWQEFYRGTNNSFVAADGRTTNFFPVAATLQTPAQDVLLALSRYEKTLAQLHAAAQRPYARFPFNYQEWAVWLPHLARMKSCAQFLNVHAQAALANDDSNLALQDIQLSFRLNETLDSQPLLISYLVQIAISHIRLLAIWEGLADHRWTDAQLVTLDAALAREDQLKNYLIGMRGERLYGLQSMDQMQRTRDWNSFSDASEASAGNSFWQATLGNSLFRLWPKGWFDQNKLAIAKFHVNYLQLAVDVPQHLAMPATQRQLETASQQSRRVSVYNLFGAMLLPALQKSSEKAARIQAYTDLARVACALERHRLAHGQFPETLEALAPRFIIQIPHDVIDGQPLKYRRTADGSFILYSVGWNETDEDGKLVLNKNGGVNAKDGDWVWRYPTQ